MAVLSNLNYTRFTKQGSTELTAILATEQAAKDAYAAMRTAAWSQSAIAASNFPPRNALQTGSDTSYDAYKFVGDYASGNQKAYAGCVAYRIAVPQDALDLSSDVTSVSVPVLVDRWLIDGIHVAAQVSSSPEPSSEWAVIRAGDASLSAQLTGLTPKAEQAGTLTVTLPASMAALAYLYVYLTLEDYETFRGFWVEGGALVSGTGMTVTLTADAQTLQTPVVPSRYYAPYLWAPMVTDYLDYSTTKLALTGKPDGAPRNPDITDYALVCSKVREGYVGVASATALMPDQYPEITIACWLKGAAGPVADVALVMLTPTSAVASGTSLGLYVDYSAGPTYKPTIKLYGECLSVPGLFGSLATTAGATLFNGAWHRVTMVYRKLAGNNVAPASSAVIYVDGVSAGSSATVANGFITGDPSGAPANLLNLAIGPNGGAEFYSFTNDYHLNDVVIDTKAWSAAEALADYQAYRALKPAPARVTGLSVGTITSSGATIAATMDPLNKGLVTVFFGLADGAEDPDAWDDSEDETQLIAPERGDAVSVPLTGLSAETEYFYRIRTVNDYGEYWTAVDSFTTSA
jgi:hypothetical protein